MTARLGLGTVQFGLDYGIANAAGRPPPEAVGSILAEARAYGIEVLDTAALYGESEEILGRHDLASFRVVTKTPRFATARITPEQVVTLVDRFRRSLERLRRPFVYGLLSHHADDLLSPGGKALWEAMARLRAEGLVQRIGASVYDSGQIVALVERFELDIVQLPANVLDQRLITGGEIGRLAARKVEVHARSAFLQGLLLMPPEEMPAYFAPFRPWLARWHAAAEAQGLTPRQAALAYLRDLPGIDIVLVGVANLTQLRQCIRDFSAAKKFDATGLACDDPTLVNPSLWKTARC